MESLLRQKFNKNTFLGKRLIETNQSIKGLAKKDYTW
jgi:hypothetical protein